jgi:hypothetical protein
LLNSEDEVIAVGTMKTIINTVQEDLDADDTFHIIGLNTIRKYRVIKSYKEVE